MNSAPGSPFSPQPARPKLRVRVNEGGPYVDLGISYSEFLIGILDTLDGLCTLDAPMAVELRTALGAVNVHRARP